MKSLLPLLLIAATAFAAEKTPDELALLDTRELHNRGTLRLQQGDLVGAEEALKASLARNDDVLRLPALHNIGHVRFGRGKVSRSSSAPSPFSRHAASPRSCTAAT